MHISYDSRCNIAYIRLRRKSKGIRTIRVSPEINIDLSSDGKVYGIEILDAREIFKTKKISLIDQSTGRKGEISLVSR